MLKVLDYFGVMPTLYVSNRSEYKTNVGAIMTIAIFLTTLITAVYFGQEFLHKESPSVNFSVETNMHPRKIKYFDEIELIITLQDLEDHPFIDKSIYFPRGYILRTITSESGQKNILIPFNLSKCSENPPTSRLFDKYDLNNFYCISKEQNFDLNDLYIGEFWGNDGFQLIQIQFVACNKGEDVSECSDNETIDKYLSQTKVSFYIVDNFISTRDYKNPFKVGLREFFFSASKNSFLSTTQFLKTLRVDSDNGLLFTSEQTEVRFGLDGLEQYSLQESSRQQFVNFNIQFSNIVSGYYRRYYKLQDFAAQVGGVFKVFSIVGYFVIYAYCKNNYCEFLIHHFFNGDYIPNRSAQRKIRLKNLDTTVDTIFNESHELTYRLENIQNINMSLEIRQLEKFQKLRVCFLKKFFPMKCLNTLSSHKTNHFYHMFKKAMNVIHNYLNVVNLLRSLHDLKEMKVNMFKKTINSQTNIKYTNKSLMKVQVTQTKNFPKRKIGSTLKLSKRVEQPKLTIRNLKSK